MIYSMTGYGKFALESDGISVEVEIKSLNNRFLDLFLRLPKSIQSGELELREIIRSKLKRGKVSVTCNIDYEGENAKTLNVNEEAARDIVVSLKKILNHSEIKDEIKLQDLLEFKEYYLTEETEENEREFELVSQALRGALKNLLEMRRKEGEAIQKDLFKRLEFLEENVESIEKLADGSIKEHFGKLQLRAQELLKDVEIDRERLMLELALMTEKYDITEEIVRLKSHIAIFRDTITNTSETGKRLNFILQEMNREVNTINSKTISSEISHIGIRMKEELEKMREQVQNVE